MSRVQAAGLLVYRLVNGTVEYLLLQASYPPYHWSPPKGHVDPGESAFQAAVRETKEEANIAEDQLDIDKAFEYHANYTTGKEGQDGGKEKTVYYWLAKLRNNDAVQLSHEHTNWRWLSMQPAIELAKFAETEAMLRKAEDYLKTKLQS